MSVHLCPYPEAGPVEEDILHEMALVRQVVSLGRAARRAAGRKVRQPLATLWVRSADPAVGAALERHREHALDELNVKALRLATPGEPAPQGWATAGEGALQVALDVHVTEELRLEGLARELVRHLQETRKTAGLQVTDRVLATVQVADGPLARALEEHRAAIAGEVLAVRLERGAPPGEAYRVEVKIEGEPVVLGVRKA